MTPAPKPVTTNPTAHHRYLADDDEHEKYAPVGVDGLLAATEKLLAVNRGLADVDERDALPNDRIFTPDRLLSERVKLDHGKTLRKLMGRVSRARNLSAMGADTFGDYTVGFLSGNPLVPALEEINPMHIVEQKRRITKMGPGGIGDPNAITQSMQAVHASQFGFIDSIAGPECMPGDSEVYTKRGWVRWDEVRDDDEFACRIEDRFAWGRASRVVRQRYRGKLITASSATINMRVTPSHRVLFKCDPRKAAFSIASAGEVAGRTIRLPKRHLPMPGNPDMRTFELPAIEVTNNNQKVFPPFDIVDWCAYMGWWLSEGSSHTTPAGRLAYDTGRVCITQCVDANPENYQEIRDLCLRMGICDCNNGKTFLSGSKQLRAYFSQWTNGCYDKWIPEPLFDAPLDARQALLDALIKGDGRSPRNRLCYCTVSRRLAESVERLAIGLGYAAYTREDRDKRPHVKTTNYVVSLVRREFSLLRSKKYDIAGRSSTGDNWGEEDFDGMVFCATVPGGFLYVRGSSNHSGFWTGNSEKAGIDVRLAVGTKLGSDGKIYQLLVNRRTGKKQWVSPSDMVGKTLKLPD